MAYLHCHKCNWSQDDFWSFLPSKWSWRNYKTIRIGYNPISYYLNSVFSKSGYINPRHIKHDDWMAKEFGWKRSDPHSWWLAWWNFKRMIRTLKRQKYLSWKQYLNSSRQCPGCGVVGLCID